MSILFFLTGISLCKSNSFFQQRGFLVRKLSGNDALQKIIEYLSDLRPLWDALCDQIPAGKGHLPQGKAALLLQNRFHQRLRRAHLRLQRRFFFRSLSHAVGAVQP